MADERLLTDPHSPHRFRVNGVMCNSDEFAPAFGCGRGTPLHPIDGQCVLW